MTHKNSKHLRRESLKSCPSVSSILFYSSSRRAVGRAGSLHSRHRERSIRRLSTPGRVARGRGRTTAPSIRGRGWCQLAAATILRDSTAVGCHE